MLASFLGWRPRPNVSELGPNIPSLPGPRPIENAGAKAGTHGEVQETSKPLICHDEFAIWTVVDRGEISQHRNA